MGVIHSSRSRMEGNEYSDMDSGSTLNSAVKHIVKVSKDRLWIMLSPEDNPISQPQSNTVDEWNRKDKTHVCRPDGNIVSRQHCLSGNHEDIYLCLAWYPYQILNIFSLFGREDRYWAFKLSHGGVPLGSWSSPGLSSTITDFGSKQLSHYPIIIFIAISRNGSRDPVRLSLKPIPNNCDFLFSSVWRNYLER